MGATTKPSFDRKPVPNSGMYIIMIGHWNDDNDKVYRVEFRSIVEFRLIQPYSSPRHEQKTTIT